MWHLTNCITLHHTAPKQKKGHARFMRAPSHQRVWKSWSLAQLHTKHEHARTHTHAHTHAPWRRRCASCCILPGWAQGCPAQPGLQSLGNCSGLLRRDVCRAVRNQHAHNTALKCVAGARRGHCHRRETTGRRACCELQERTTRH